MARADMGQPTDAQPARSEGTFAFLALALTGIALLGVYLYMGQRDFLLSPVWIYLFLYAVAFGCYLYAAARLAPRLLASRKVVPLIFVFGILFRLAVVFAPPSISTDIYRYVWDGRLILHDQNPYHYAPNASHLKFLRDSKIWIPMEYKAYQEIYMPVSQVFFGVGYYLFGSSLTGFKLMFVGMDIGVMTLILALLKTLRLPPILFIWYAWSPLPVTEFALAGHQDVTGIFFLLLAFVLVRSPKTEGWAAACLAAAVLTKGFVLLLLPLFWRTFGRRFAWISVWTLAILGVPLWVRFPQFLHGMKQYLDFVDVNAGLFHLLNFALSKVTLLHFSLASKISDAAMLAVSLWSARRPAESPNDLLRRSFIVLAVILLVVPTLFPWYLLWLLPFMCVFGRRPSWAFVLLTGLVVLVYTFYFRIHTYWWTPVIEYVPFYSVLWLEWRQWQRLQSVTSEERSVVSFDAKPEERPLFAS